MRRLLRLARRGRACPLRLAAAARRSLAGYDRGLLTAAANNIRADGAIEAMTRDDPAAWMKP